MKFKSRILTACKNRNFTFYIFLFCLCIAPGAEAQNAPGPIVRQIEIQYAGPSTVSKERILANMRTAVGKPYSEQNVEEDIRNLYATGDITNVRIFGEQRRDGVKVVVVVQTRAEVGEVLVEGASSVKPNKLRKDLSVKVGESLNETNLESDRQKILQTYEDRGYSDTQVEYKVDTNDATGKARVIFTVNEGGRTIIKAVRFEGNQAFGEKTLRKLMKTKPQTFLSFLTKTGRLKNEQLSDDLNALREFYQNHGYVDVEINEPNIAQVDGGKVEITISVMEGSQYRVENVNISGAKVFTDSELLGTIKTIRGTIYSPQALRDDTKQIQDMYGSKGYIDLQVNAETTTAGAGLMNVSFQLDEGIQSYVEHVNIAGNTRTKDKVIRRELAVAPGDVYNTVRVDASKKRLENLNYFSAIEPYPTDSLVPGRKDFNIRVEEKQTGSLNFGAGFSSIDSLLGFAEVTQGNFDILNWPRFTGGGQKFRTRVQYGTRRKDFVMSLTEPWFLDYQLSVGGELFYRDATFLSEVYSQRNYGFSLNSRKPINQFTSLRLDYRLEQISIYDLAKGVSQSIRQEEGDRLKSSITAGITNDTRDSVFLTRKGHRIDFSTYVAGGPLGGNTQIYGFGLEGSQYFLLPWDTILTINGEVGVVNTWGSGDRVPIFDRLYLGGANNLRGFRYRGVGPKDERGEPVGGNTLARLTLEYTFPNIDRVRGAVFGDTGFVNAKAYDYSLSTVNSDVGIGLRLNLPIGPVRLDYGFPVQSDRVNGTGGKFHFNIGYQF